MNGLPGQPYHRLLANEVTPRLYAVLGSFTVFAGWMLASIIILGTQASIRADPEGTVSWFGLLATNLSLVVLIPLTILVARKLNRQAPGLLSSVTGGIRWQPLGWFVGAALVIEFLMLGVILVGGVDLIGEAKGVAPDAAAVIAVALLTSTFQAAGEEYFFRGYLLQAVGVLVRNSVVAILVTTVLFTMAHGVWPWQSPALFLDRFAFGLVAGWLAIRTGGLEAPIAAHAVNNVITFGYAALTDTVGASLGVKDAPWGLVAIDVTKFALFGFVAVLLAHRLGLKTQHTGSLVADDLPRRRLV